MQKIDVRDYLDKRLPAGSTAGARCFLPLARREPQGLGLLIVGQCVAFFGPIAIGARQRCSPGHSRCDVYAHERTTSDTQDRPRVPGDV